MKNIKKIGLGLLPLIVLISLFSMHSQKAAAAGATSAQQVQNATFNFVNRGLIKVTVGGNELDFVDGKPFDPGMKFTANDDCGSTIDPPDDMFSIANLGSYPTTLDKKYIHIKYDDQSGNGCQEVSVNSSPSGANVGMRTWVQWTDASTLQLIDGSKTFTKAPNNDYYLDQDEAGKSCQDRILKGFLLKL